MGLGLGSGLACMGNRRTPPRLCGPVGKLMRIPDFLIGCRPKLALAGLGQPGGRAGVYLLRAGGRTPHRSSGGRLHGGDWSAWLEAVGRWVLSRERRARQSSQAPEEAREPSWGTAKGGHFHRAVSPSGGGAGRSEDMYSGLTAMPSAVCLVSSAAGSLPPSSLAARFVQRAGRLHRLLAARMCRMRPPLQERGGRSGRLFRIVFIF